MNTPDAPSAKWNAGAIVGMVVAGILFAARLAGIEVILIDPADVPSEMIAVAGSLVAFYRRRETDPSRSAIEHVEAGMAKPATERDIALRALAAWVMATQPMSDKEAETRSGSAVTEMQDDARDVAVKLLEQYGGARTVRGNGGAAR